MKIRPTVMSLMSIAALMVLFACGAGASSSSADEAAQQRAKAIATGDFQRIWEMCNPSGRERMSEEERERYIAGEWLEGPRAAREAVLAWMRSQARSAEAVELLSKRDTRIAPISVTEYGDWATVRIDRRVFVVDGETRSSVGFPGDIEFELVMEDGSWWTNCGESKR